MEKIAFLHFFWSFIGILLLVAGGVYVSRWLRPHRPQEEKLATYESGSEPIGNAWGAVNSRWYVIGLVFILLEIETLLLFPWAVVCIDPRTKSSTGQINPLYMAISGSLFILMLGIGLAYALIKGKLMESIYSHHMAKQEDYKGVVPIAYYERLNTKYANIPSHPIDPIDNLDN